MTTSLAATATTGTGAASCRLARPAGRGRTRRAGLVEGLVEMVEQLERDGADVPAEDPRRLYRVAQIL